MAEEEDENQPKIKKDKDKDLLPELAPGDVVLPYEFKMFDKANMSKTLNIPRKQVYGFQKELSNSIQKRLESIRVRLRADEVDPSADNDSMELSAGFQSWEEIDPKSGQLLEYSNMLQPDRKNQQQTNTDDSTKQAPITQLTPSVMMAMKQSLPRPLEESKSAMPEPNIRILAPTPKFAGLQRTLVSPEYSDYHETIEKWEREWKDTVGRRPSESQKDEKHDLKAKETREMKKTSSLAQQTKGSTTFKEKNDGVNSAQRNSIKFVQPNLQQATSVVPTKKSKIMRKPAGTPAFLDGVIEHLTTTLSTECDLTSWLQPTSIVPVFRIRDIPADIENCVVTIARVTHSKFFDEQVVARLIRSALERHHGYACRWHVIVGRQFGLQVESDKGNFLFMYIGHVGYVVFRTFG